MWIGHLGYYMRERSRAEECVGLALEKYLFLTVCHLIANTVEPWTFVSFGDEKEFCDVYQYLLMAARY